MSRFGVLYYDSLFLSIHSVLYPGPSSYPRVGAKKQMFILKNRITVSLERNAGHIALGDIMAGKNVPFDFHTIPLISLGPYCLAGSEPYTHFVIIYSKILTKPPSELGTMWGW